MPGVPSGRGCDACRKQKKKCDAAQPSCSRCTRLGLMCIGGGQRRYKFIQIEETAVTKQKSPPKSRAIAKLGGPSTALSTDYTRLAGSFISSLSVKDPRFDLATYGIFLPEIPKRIGSHPALDASASALMCAYPAVYTRQPSCEALTKYGRALHVLRLSLDAPDSDKIIEILCAIYFLLICQTWIARPPDQLISHGKAVSKILSAVAGKFTVQSLREGFEHQVLISMCMIVIIESIFDHTIRLHPWYRTNLIAGYGLTKPRNGNGTKNSGSSDGLSHNSITIETLARVPELVHAPRGNMPEIQDLYQRARLDTEELVTRQAAFIKQLAAGVYASPTSRGLAVERIIPLCQTAHSMLLTITLGCNAILSVFHPWDNSLVEDCVRFCDDTLLLGQQVSCYRPLGASHFPLCLIAAYIVVADPVNQKLLRRLLVDFSEDFASVCWLDIAEKSRKSYTAGRLKVIEENQYGYGDEIGQTIQGEEVSICAVQ